jgi:hypothetical protein
MSLETTLVRAKDGAAPFQSKEIGESAISQVAPAIANAVYAAVGVRIMDLPSRLKRCFARCRSAGQETRLESAAQGDAFTPHAVKKLDLLSS